jgi:phage baseplate assembly protein W
MEYKIALDNVIDFAPESTTAEILQNVRTILNTRLGTVPLARGLGISWEHVDMPMPVARSVMQGVVIDAIEEFEPRARVERVTFDGDGADGVLRPTVIISIREA